MRLLHTLLSLYGYIIIIRAVLSWFNPNPYSPPVQFIMKITEPVLAPLRQILPDMGGIDLSPLAAMVIIWLLMSVI
ncbi:MAG: YggT family protein [Candidatus Latescibacterota bacterium]|jgi:YggT family protein